jgi:hypothetical protein
MVSSPIEYKAPVDPVEGQVTRGTLHDPIASVAQTATLQGGLFGSTLYPAIGPFAWIKLDRLTVFGKAPTINDTPGDRKRTNARDTKIDPRENEEDGRFKSHLPIDPKGNESLT